MVVRMLPQLEGGRAVATFSDIEGHWAQSEIEEAVAAGLLEGYPDGTFRPEDKMSREEMAVLLARMIQLDAQGTQTPVFSDVERTGGPMKKLLRWQEQVFYKALVTIPSGRNRDSRAAKWRHWYDGSLNTSKKSRGWTVCGYVTGGKQTIQEC